jgi:hypothetical protein
VSRGSWLSSGAVELVVPADPRVVYDVVSDVTRIGERSPECRSAEWVAGVPGTVGAVFRGHNRSGWAARWSRRCEVTAAVPGRLFAFRTVPERLDRFRHDSTTWTYRLQAVDGGTRVEHSYDITMMPARPLLAVYGLLLPHHRDMRPQMLHNLQVLQDQLAG